MTGLFRRPLLRVVSVGLAVASILGGTAGVAFAKHSTTIGGVCGNGTSGCNISYIGTLGDVSPATFTSCLPANSWDGIYIWNSPTQEWLHYFNPALVPSYVNQSQAGGISMIPRYSGVVLIARLGSSTQTVNVLDSNADSCN